MKHAGALQNMEKGNCPKDDVGAKDQGSVS